MKRKGENGVKKKRNKQKKGEKENKKSRQEKQRDKKKAQRKNEKNCVYSSISCLILYLDTLFYIREICDHTTSKQSVNNNST